LVVFPRARVPAAAADRFRCGAVTPPLPYLMSDVLRLCGIEYVAGSETSS
jgi:hypothetical protein